MAPILQLLTDVTKRTQIGVFGAVVVLGAAVLVAYGVGLFDDDGGSGPELAEPECVDVELPSTLQSNTEFEVSYRFAEDAGLDCPEVFDPMLLVPSTTFGLSQGDQKLSTLLTGSRPSVLPPDSEIPAFAIVGPGPHRFLLPKLEEGTYVLCSGVSVDVSDGSEPDYDAIDDLMASLDPDDGPIGSPEIDALVGLFTEPFCRKVTVRA